jgi:hypothetical protein
MFLEELKYPETKRTLWKYYKKAYYSRAWKCGGSLQKEFICLLDGYASTGGQGLEVMERSYRYQNAFNTPKNYITAILWTGIPLLLNL